MHFSLRRNLYLKVFSLLLAIACWFVVRSEEDRLKDFAVPVDYVNLPQTLDLSGPVTDSVAVRLRAPEAVLSITTADRLSLRLDLSHPTLGEQSIPLTPEMIRAPAGAEVVRISPELIPVRIERRAKREVPVVAEFGGSPPEGYARSQYVIEPPVVTIEGPASEVERVTRATTGTIFIEGQTADYDVEVTPIPDAPPGSRVRVTAPPGPVRVTISIAAKGGAT